MITLNEIIKEQLELTHKELIKIEQELKIYSILRFIKTRKKLKFKN